MSFSEKWLDRLRRHTPQKLRRFTWWCTVERQTSHPNYQFYGIRPRNVMLIIRLWVWVCVIAVSLLLPYFEVPNILIPVLFFGSFFVLFPMFSSYQSDLAFLIENAGGDMINFDSALSLSFFLIIFETGVIALAYFIGCSLPLILVLALLHFVLPVSSYTYEDDF